MGDDRKMTKEEYNEIAELNYALAQKSDTNHQLVEQMAKLSEENAELKCECRRCVYSDSPCILSDYGKDGNGICDHFKDVFDENAELKEQCSILADCNSCTSSCKTENLEMKKQLTKAKELLERLLITSCNSDVLNLLPNCSEVLRVRVEAEQFLNEVEK